MRVSASGLDTETPRGRTVKARLALLLEEEVADEHGVDAGGVEAADGVARGADQRFAEEVERSVVEHREAGGFAGGVEEVQ